MALGKINHIDFCVDDLEKTVKYFTEKMGFKEVRRTHGGGSVELVSPAGDEIFEFSRVTEEYLRKPGVIDRPYLNHICFEVEDIDKEYEELKSKGVHFEDADIPKYFAPTDRKLATTFDADDRRWIQLVEVEDPPVTVE